MKRCLLLAFSFVGCTSQSSPPRVQSTARVAVAPITVDASIPSYANLATVLEPLRAKYNLPALGGAIVTDEKILALGVVGVRKHGAPDLAKEYDPFHLGSDTKAMTAVVIGKAVDAGKLTWTTTIGQAFPDVPMNAAYKDVTLEELLAMRGGLPHDPKITNRELRALPGTTRELHAIYVQNALSEAPALPPHTKTSYSNASYVIAAAMAERAMNASWNDLIQSDVFTPLQMTGAGFGSPGTPGKIDAPWAHFVEHGKFTPVEPGPGADNPPAMAPAGGVHVPLAAWSFFIHDQLRSFDGRGALLKPETYAYLHAAHFGGDYFAGWGTAERSWAGGITYTHAGSNTVNYAVVWMAPKKKVAYLVTTNQGDDADVTEKACDDAIGALIKWNADQAH